MDEADRRRTSKMEETGRRRGRKKREGTSAKDEGQSRERRMWIMLELAKYVCPDVSIPKELLEAENIEESNDATPFKVKLCRGRGDKLCVHLKGSSCEPMSQCG